MWLALACPPGARVQPSCLGADPETDTSTTVRPFFSGTGCSRAGFPLCRPSQIQFHVTIGHTALSLYVNCDFPHWMHYSLICYAITFIVLFGNFYYQTYRRQQPRRDASSSKAGKAVANGALNGLSKNANGAAVTGGKEEKPQENSGRRKRKGRAKRD